MPRDSKCSLVEDVGGGERRRADDAALLRLERHLLHAQVGEVRDEQRVEHVLGDLPSGDEAVERGVLQELRLAQPLAHGVPLADAEDDQADVAALAREDRVDRPVAVAHLTRGEARLDARHGVRQRPVADLRDRLVGRNLDELPDADLLALVQRAQQPERARDRRGVVDQVPGRQDRRVLGDAGLEREARARREGGVGGDPVGVGTVEPERR